jgi:hypothetical protein
MFHDRLRTSIGEEFQIPAEVNMRVSAYRDVLVLHS